MNNIVHKVELRADSKGSRQRVGELNLKFSGIELDLSALTTAANGKSRTHTWQLPAFKEFVSIFCVSLCTKMFEIVKS